VAEPRSLPLLDYLQASIEATRRTRTMVFILLVAGIVTFAGYLNALEGTWMRQRVHAFENPDSLYARLTLQPKEHGLSDSLYRREHRIFLDRLVEAYVQNTYSIHVPFFGVTFDANDLGLVGGLAFVVILMLLRFSLSRERENLSLLFEHAKSADMIATCYFPLAMRQVFTLSCRSSRGHARLDRRFLSVVVEHRP
jgi:hypothetical protein